jgi:hypothetical protein
VGVSELIKSEAIINLLDRKGVTIKEGVFEEIKRV